jgi:hypothetical protein
MLHQQTATEYFKELVESAMARQHLHAADLTEYYVVNLLCQYVRPDVRPDSGDDAQPLALRLAQALESGGREQRARLRSVGDFSLFMSGFFSDSFARRSVDVDYYRSMGAYAYASLSRAEDEAFAEVFDELARKFVGFMDVLADISERTTLASTNDLLRIYEKWLRTGSPRDAKRLVELGVVPNHSVGRSFLQ